MNIETYDIEARFEVAIKAPNGKTTDANSLAMTLRIAIEQALDGWREGNNGKALTGQLRMDVRRNG